MKNYMKRFSIFIVIIFFTSFSAASDPTPDIKNIRIGSFNIEQFGTAKISRPNTLTVLAQIATGYDVLAIQEVGSNNSTALEQTCIEVMNAYLARINELTGTDSYAYVSDNQYAILYRKSTVELVRRLEFSSTHVFTYQPLTAHFRSISGNFDFAMLVIHTSPDKARTEIPALMTAIAEVATLYSEPDVVCLGDFNADGGYFDEGVGVDLKGFDGYLTAIPNNVDTTVASPSNTYDRIQLTLSLTTDYTNTWDVVRFDRKYDMCIYQGTDASTEGDSALSDHFPVWAEFYVDRDED